MRDSKPNKRIIPIEIKAILIIVILLFVGLLTTYILKSYAKFEKKESHNIVNAKVGEFYKEFAYTGSVQEYTVPTDGYYDIELWGASGRAVTTSSYAGLGGYSKGTIYLEEDEVLYFYVGENGKMISSNCSAGSYNGGGARDYVGTYCGSGGGGATDVRVTSGTWNESTSLRSRIMVAGAGGGGNSGRGGVGGSLIAGDGIIAVNETDPTNSECQGKGGTQTIGGPAPRMHATGGSNGTAGVFGGGGKGGRNASTTTSAGGASGGGGYFGGSGASGIGNGMFSAGGGSSYISGYAGVNAVNASQVLTNNTIHYSNKYFINGKMQGGVNLGDGKAKVKLIKTTELVRVNTKLDNIRYIKTCVSGHNKTTANDYRGEWVELQAIKNGVNLAKGKPIISTHPANGSYPYSRLVDGLVGDPHINRFYTTTDNTSNSTPGQKCLTIDLGQEYDLDEIAVWGWPFDGRTYYNNTLSAGPTNTTGTTPLTNVFHNFPGTTGYVETIEGRRYNAWNLEAVE